VRYTVCVVCLLVSLLSKLWISCDGNPLLHAVLHITLHSWSLAWVAICSDSILSI
jgi:hypothetical protein